MAGCTIRDTLAADALIELFRDKIYHFPVVRPVVFLCGGANSRVRDRIAEYFGHGLTVWYFTRTKYGRGSHGTS